MIALLMVFVKYGFLLPIGASTILASLDFSLLVIAMISLAAGGNIINDIYDVEIDRINKPDKVLIGEKISERTANRWYIVLNLLAVGIGFYLANKVGKPGFAALFIVISALLYLYASYLKGKLLIGNILVSALITTSILSVAVIDLLPATHLENQVSQSNAFRILLDYMMFAFLLNIIREIVKDIQDINGDKNGGLTSLPIAIGRKRATNIVFVLGVLAALAVVLYMYAYLYNAQIIVIYFLFLVLAPLLYFCVKAWNAEKRKDYVFLSLLLKLIMFFGMCSILLYPDLILN